MIMRFWISLLLLVSANSWAQSKKAVLNITRNNTSAYKIVIPDGTNNVASKAAAQLSSYIEKMSGVKIPVINQAAAASQNTPFIYLRQFSGNGRLHPDGFIKKVSGKNLIIEGGTRKGILYGMYSLLEEEWGCRMYTAEVFDIPRKTTITVPASLNKKQEPAFDYRSIFYRELVVNPVYADWHKLYNIYDFQKHDYVFEDWGMFVHTFDKLVPSKIYFAGHPEYYALVKGKRSPTQLCPANQQVAQLIIDTLKSEIAKHPGNDYWSVSQNDNFDYCQCDICQKINKEEGGPQGAIIRLVNKVAAAFPDKNISTLAYQYSRAAPLKTKPLPNVNIMLCYQVDKAAAASSDKNSLSFINDLNNWQQLTRNIFLWDYIAPFAYAQSPYPNFDMLQPNIQYFKRKGIPMMFQQGWDKGEFSELRCYLVAKLLWNPDINASEVMDDFLYGYYKEAAPQIKKYITLQQAARARNKQAIPMYGNPVMFANSFLTPALLNQYGALFDEAEKRVASKPDILFRVQQARLPLTFVLLEFYKKDYAAAKKSNIAAANGLSGKRETMIKELNEFIAICKKGKITQLGENGTKIEKYEQETLAALNK